MVQREIHIGPIFVIWCNMVQHWYKSDKDYCIVPLRAPIGGRHGYRAKAISKKFALFEYVFTRFMDPMDEASEQRCRDYRRYHTWKGKLQRIFGLRRRTSQSSMFASTRASVSNRYFPTRYIWTAANTRCHVARSFSTMQCQNCTAPKLPKWVGFPTESMLALFHPTQHPTGPFAWRVTYVVFVTSGDLRLEHERLVRRTFRLAVPNRLLCITKKKAEKHQRSAINTRQQVRRACGRAPKPTHGTICRFSWDGKMLGSKSSGHQHSTVDDFHRHSTSNVLQVFKLAIDMWASNSFKRMRAHSATTYHFQ